MVLGVGAQEHGRQVLAVQHAVDGAEPRLPAPTTAFAAWARAGAFHNAAAYSSETIEIWFARDLTLGERQLDSEEFLDVFTATPEELLAWCQQGLVTDAKTLTGALWLQNVLSGAWPLTWQSAT